MVTEFNEKNMKSNITGLLTCKTRDVMQLIEGNKDTVIQLFDNIKNDKRHKRVIRLIEGESINPFFPSWKMAFQFINDNEKFDNTFCSDFLQLERYVEVARDRRISLLFNSFKMNEVISISSQNERS